MTTQQLELMPTPKVDLAQYVHTEHERAELLRLLAGQDGCGCRDCQPLYLRMGGDLAAVFKDRVKVYGSVTFVVAGSAGAESQDRPETWVANDLVCVAAGKAYAVSPNGQTVCLGEWVRVERCIVGNWPMPAGLTEEQREAITRAQIIYRSIESGKQRTVDTSLRAPRTKQRNHIRVRSRLAPRRNAANVRPLKAGRKLTLHPVRPQ